MSDACWCDYDDPPEFFHQELRKAKKRHKCSECRRAIHPGEQYKKTYGKWDGEVRAFNMCCRCMAILQHYEAHVPCFCWAFSTMLSDLREDVHEHGLQGTGLLFELGRLAVTIRRNEAFA